MDELYALLNNAMTAETLRRVRAMAMGAMETGNPERARTIVTELAEFNFIAAQALRADIVSAYGTDI